MQTENKPFLINFLSLIVGFLIICNGLPVKAGSFREDLYEKIGSSISRESCEQRGRLSQNDRNANCANSPQGKSTADLVSLSEASFYDHLAQYKIEDLQCGLDYWSSLSDPKNSSLLLQKYNQTIQKLGKLRNGLEEIRKRNAFLQGQLNLSLPEKVLLEHPDKGPLYREYKLNQEELMAGLKVQELLLSQIPHSNNELLRETLLEKAGPGFTGPQVSLLTASDLQKLTGKMKQSWQKEIQDLKSQKKGSHFDLSYDQRESLGSDAELLGKHLKEYPEAQGQAVRFQCQALARQRGREAKNTAISLGSLFLPVGSLALGKAAQMAFVARGGLGLVKGVSYASRMAGAGAMVLGSGQAAEAVMSACVPSEKMRMKNSCSQNPESMYQEMSYSQCVEEGTLALLGINGGALGVAMGRASGRLAAFIRETKNANFFRGMSDVEKMKWLNIAGDLNDAERKAAAAYFVKNGGSLTQSEADALILAHNTFPEKVYFELTESELRQKMKILLDGGFSKDEADKIMRSGLAGNADPTYLLNQFKRYDDLIKESPNKAPSSYYRLRAEAASAAKFPGAQEDLNKAYELYAKEKGIQGLEGTALRTRLNSFSERDLSQLEDYAASVKNNSLVESAMQRRFDLIEKEIKSSKEFKNNPGLAKEVFSETVQSHYQSLLRESRKSEPDIFSDRAKVQIEIMRKIFPGLR